jgi:Skp family chaperone for outer membrane proteins
MIKVNTPDGGVAQFPPGTSKETIASALQKRFPAPQVINTEGKTSRERSWGDTLSDVGLSGAQGFLTGVEGLVGMPGDIQQLAGMGASWGAGKLGFSPEVQEGAKSLGLPQLPTAQDVGAFTESIVGPKYKPDTDIGRYVGSIAEMVPAAAAGPGSLLRKGAMAVVPGVAMEGTKDVTGGNPAAEAVAGIGASILTAGRGNAGTKEMLKKVGKSDKAYAKLERDVNNAYDRLRSAGIKYDANAVDAAITDVAQFRINPNLAPKAAGLREEFARFAGQGMDFQDLDEMERIATTIMRSTPDATEKMFVGQILGKIKDVRERGAFITNGTVPANEVNALVKEAKELARRRIIARDINKMKDKSEWYLSGPESGLRNQFKNYGQKNMQNLTDAEGAAFKSVVNREGVLNPLHTYGGRLTQAVGLGAGIYAGFPVETVIGIVGSNLARRFMEAYTKKGVDNALKTVLAGRSAQEKAAIRDAVSKWEARTRAALSSSAAAQQSAPTEIDIPGGGLPVDQNTGGRVERKSGGRINSPICSEVRQVRALLSEKTASMLSMPDDAVATALHIAKGK